MHVPHCTISQSYSTINFRISNSNYFINRFLPWMHKTHLSFSFQNKNYTTHFHSLILEVSSPVTHLDHVQQTSIHLPCARPDTLKCERTRHVDWIVGISWVTPGVVRAMTGCRVLWKRGTCGDAALVTTVASEFANVHKVCLQYVDI